MTNNSNNMLAFVFGCAFGSVVTYFIAKNVFAQKFEQYKADETEKLEMRIQRDIAKAHSDHDHIIREYGYVGRDTPEEVEEQEVQSDESTYYISIDEYGELYDHETYNLIMYADGILVDEDDEIVDDPSSLLGKDIYDRLRNGNATESDSYFIRNDAKKCDYEVSLSAITYREIAYEKPNIVLHGEEEYDY